MRSLKIVLGMTFLSFALIGPVGAAVIGSLEELEGVIPEQNLFVELFENFPGNTVTVNDQDLTSSAIVNDTDGNFVAGPGIVNSGLRFSSSSIPVQLTLQRFGTNGALSGSGLRPDNISAVGILTIDFLDFVTHAGFELFQFEGLDDNAVSVSVFGVDDTTLLFTDNQLVAAGVDKPRNFFGFTDQSGIGLITLQSSVLDFSPFVDNLTYGVVAVPEPSTMALLCFGMGIAVVRNRRRRRAILNAVS